MQMGGRQLEQQQQQRGEQGEVQVVGAEHRRASQHQSRRVLQVVQRLQGEQRLLGRHHLRGAVAAIVGHGNEAS